MPPCSKQPVIWTKLSGSIWRSLCWYTNRSRIQGPNMLSSIHDSGSWVLPRTCCGMTLFKVLAARLPEQPPLCRPPTKPLVYLIPLQCIPFLLTLTRVRSYYFQQRILPDAWVQTLSRSEIKCHPFVRPALTPQSLSPISPFLFFMALTTKIIFQVCLFLSPLANVSESRGHICHPSNPRA